MKNKTTAFCRCVTSLNKLYYDRTYVKDGFVGYYIGFKKKEKALQLSS